MSPLKLNLQNKRGMYSYQEIETFECGVKLTADEFSAIRNKSVTFNESSHAFFKDGELWLTNLTITIPLGSGTQSLDGNRPKKLLMHRRELNQIKVQVDQKGLTLVPKRLYNKNQLIKVELVLAKGLNKVNKKNILKEKDIARDAQREMKNY